MEEAGGGGVKVEEGEEGEGAAMTRGKMASITGRMRTTGVVGGMKVTEAEMTGESLVYGVTDSSQNLCLI